MRATIYLPGSENRARHPAGRRRKTYCVKHYSKGEGFTGIETCQNSVYKDVAGPIWFGTINGLSKYNPANQIRNNSEPITSITDVKLFYESIANTGTKQFAGDWNKISQLDLPHDQNRISFDFMAINFSNPEAVKYQWKLEGADKEWSPVSKRQKHFLLQPWAPVLIPLNCGPATKTGFGIKHR